MKKKNKIIILISLSFLILCFNYGYFQSSSEEIQNIQTVRFLPSYYNNLTSPIYIDGTATGPGAHNWTWAVSQTWCTGSGTQNDPYIIANLTINGMNSSSCIEIIYSKVFFRIEDCTLFNSSSYTHDGGINLYSVDNGILINNIVTKNGWNYFRTFGMMLQSCNNITIFNNTVSKNSRGMNFAGCYNITVANNTISNNTEDGIYLHGTNSTLLNNVIFNNSGSGIGLYDSNNIVLNNTISNNYCGVYLAYANNNTISMNTISNNQFNGIRVLYNSSNNLIFYNYLIKNSPNALDDASNNQWDNGKIGNYWSDYSGKDDNDNGIGDNPYYISGSAGSQDNYPIWLDPIVINHPTDIDYIEGDTGHNITWIATDNNPNAYKIMKEGVEIVSDTWSSGDSLIVDVDGLSSGDYNYTIIIWDNYDNVVTDTVIVSVSKHRESPKDINGYSGLLIILSVAGISVVVISIKRRKIV